MGILTDIKMMLGLREVDAFDAELIMFINSAFSVLRQINVGPDPQIVIQDDSTDWSAFEEQSPNIQMVKEFVYLSVRITFDPPTVGAVMEAYQHRLKELAFRLQTVAENET